MNTKYTKCTEIITFVVFTCTCCFYLTICFVTVTGVECFQYGDIDEDFLPKRSIFFLFLKAVIDSTLLMRTCTLLRRTIFWIVSLLVNGYLLFFSFFLIWCVFNTETMGSGEKSNKGTVQLWCDLISTYETLCWPTRQQVHSSSGCPFVWRWKIKRVNCQ